MKPAEKKKKMLHENLKSVFLADNILPREMTHLENKISVHFVFHNIN